MEREARRSVTVASSDQQGQSTIRILDPSKDLEQLADLIELSFGSELALTENRIVSEIRRMARLGPLLQLMEPFNLDPVGLVWDVGNMIVGNVTLARDGAVVRGQWVVSNVAVHPDYQGQGIARRLMLAALDWIGAHKGQKVVLQVRRNNAVAQALYEKLGFRRYATLVELMWKSEGVRTPRSDGNLVLHRLRPKHWRRALDLALAAQPEEDKLVRPIRRSMFERTIGQRLEEGLRRLVRERETHRFYLERGDEFLALLEVDARVAARRYRMKMTVHPGIRGQLETPLADRALAIVARYSPGRTFADVPASHPEALEAMRDRGFTTLRVLDQLFLDLHRRQEISSPRERNDTGIAKTVPDASENRGHLPFGAD